MNNKNNPSGFDKLVMVVLVMGPVLNIYASPTSMSLYGFITFFLSVLFLARFVLTAKSVRGKLFWSGLGVYFLYYAFNQVLSGYYSISIIQSFLCFFMAYNCFSKDWYIRVMKIFAAICIVFFFIQYFGYMATGARVSGILPFLPMNYDVDVASFRNTLIYAERSSSFFSEPSHFAQFLIPLLAIELFYDNKKYHLLFAGIIFIVLLLLQSGTGLLGMLPIAFFILPFFSKDNKFKTGTRLLLILTVLVVVVLSLYLFFDSTMGEGILGRSDELSSEYDGGSRSGYLRVWRGYFVFNSYSVIEKIFGVTNPDVLLDHVVSSGQSFGIRAELYFNALQSILLHTGLIGLMIFIYVVIKLWKGNSVCGKAIICTLIAISCVEDIYLSNVMLVHLLLAECMKEEIQWK